MRIPHQFIILLIVCACASQTGERIPEPVHVALDTLFVIGGSDGPPEDLIYRGRQSRGPSIDLDREGRLWILNTGAGRLDVYSTADEKLASFGQRGRGPGEFFRPWALKAARDGAWTWDEGNQQLCRWSLEGGLEEVTRTEISSYSLESITLGEEGQIWYLKLQMDKATAQEIPVSLIQLKPGGSPDTLMQASAAGGVTPNGLAAAFAYIPKIASGYENTLIIAPTHNYELFCFREGEETRWTLPSFNVEYSEREKSAEGRRGASSGGVSIELPLLSHKPDVASLEPVSRDELWVKTVIMKDKVWYRWDRIDNEGRRVGSYWLPREWSQIRTDGEITYLLTYTTEDGYLLLAARMTSLSERNDDH